MSKRLLVSVLALQLLSSVTPAFALNEVDDIRRFRQSALELRARGDMDACFAAYNQAADRATRVFGPESTYVADIYFEEGMTAFRTDQYEIASKCLQKAVEINPNSSEARLKLAELDALTGRYDSAKTQIQKVLARHPGNVEARAILADCYQKEGNCAKATKEYFHVNELAQGKSAKVETVAFSSEPDAGVRQAPTSPVANLRSPAVEVKAKTELKAEPTQQGQIKKAEAKKAEAKKPEPKKTEPKEADKKNERTKADSKSRKPERADRKKGHQKEPKPVAVHEKQPAPDKESDIVAKSASKTQTQLSSKAKLLTPMNGAKMAPIEGTTDETASKPATAKEKPKAQMSAVDSTPVSEADNESTAETRPKPAKKEAAAPMPKPRIEKPKRTKPGFVPPPPPLPIYMQPVAPAPQQPPAKSKPKPLEKKAEPAPAAKSDGAGSASGGDDGDFLLEWGGGGAKKKRK